MLTSKHDAESLAQFLQHELEGSVPYLRTSISTLGGDHRSSVFVTVSLDDPETWSNRIYENSRHFRLHVLHDGEIGLTSDSGRKGRAGMMEHVALKKRWRKTKARDFDEVAEKIVKYIREVE